MDVGVGLPATIPGTSPDQIIEWSMAAEAHGFSSLGVIDRLVYGNAEPLVTLAAVAAVTNRIRLVTSVLVVPFRSNAALLAKQAATLNLLAEGRLVLGMAVGGYEDDYEVSGVPFRERGQLFDEMLEQMVRIWNGEPQGFAGAIGPEPGLGRSQIIFGGQSRRTFRRVAVHGNGWIGGSRGVEAFQTGAEGVRRAWVGHSRQGRPRLLALPYFALGQDAAEVADSFLGDHYAIEGPVSRQLAADALTSETAIRNAVEAYDRAGCEELILAPCSSDPHQVHLLADALA